MEEKKSKFDRDNTLIWVLIGLLICITIQMVGVMHLKEDIKEKEEIIKKLQK
jgi:heme/copper-type cytochrome/quinol oxidase subunit 4